MKDLKVIETNGVRVLTTGQLANAYETDEQIITNNYNRNRARYIEGKHYVCLRGLEKREFIEKNQNDFSSYTRARAIYLWTERGALLHAKSLNTDKAWEVYDYLVEFYFRVQENKIVQKELKPNTKMVVNIPENPTILKAIQKVRDDLICMDVLLEGSIRFLHEKEYKERQSAVDSTMNILIGDLARLQDLQPKLVEKYY